MTPMQFRDIVYNWSSAVAYSGFFICVAAMMVVASIKMTISIWKEK